MAATKDGLPRRAYAYAPTADPATWKLPFLTASGAPDPDRLPGAAAALSEGGFRGQKADIPADAIAMVKSKLRQAYRKWKGSDVEYPESIREAEIRESADGPVAIREATVLLDRGSCPAQVVFAPNGDAYVVPNYDGQFAFAQQPLAEPSDSSVDYSARWDASDAADMLKRLLGLKAGETDEPDQVAMLDKAIDSVMAFIRAESKEMVPAEDGTDVAEAARPILAAITEVGRRNSSKDQSVIQQVHDHAVGLGAVCGMKESSAPEPTEGEPVIESDAAVAGVPITFRESGLDHAAVVTLAEADPVFDRANKTVWITPIKPGWGNKRDKFYYTKGALKEATESGMFNHLKMYRDHPRKSDEKDLPERSIKDWFATTREAVWDEKRERPRVPIKVHDEADLQRFEDVPEQIAFSVLGNGVARPGRVGGEDGRIVESFQRVRSVDWVTEAGAGGAIDFAESAAEEHEQMSVEIESLSDDQLEAELARRRASKVKEAADGAVADPPKADEKKDDEPKAEAKVESDAKKDETESKTEAAAGDTKVEAKVETKTEPATAPEGFVSREEFEALKRKMDEPTVREAASKIVKGALAESTLPGRAKDLIVSRFAEASFGNGYVYTDEQALQTAVKGEIEQAAKLLGLQATGSRVKGLGGDTEDTGDGSVREAVAARIEERWGKDALPIRENGARQPVEGEPPIESAAGQQLADRISQKIGK